jgi:hypothetical protein
MRLSEPVNCCMPDISASAGRCLDAMAVPPAAEPAR